MNEMNTPDKSWILITGASSGFGEEFARQYAAQGHSLVLVARRLDQLQSLAEALRQQFHIEVVVAQVDLSNIAAVIQLHQRLGARGIEIDILINNAGHGLQGPFADAPLDAVLSMVQLDVASLTAVTHVLVEGLSDCEDASYRSTSVFKWHCTMVELTRRSDGTPLFAWRNVVQIPSPVLAVADRSFEAELLHQCFYGC
jgi:NADP-dependent 3-hydroxy acid dehydrogenase YdfG